MKLKLMNKVFLVVSLFFSILSLYGCREEDPIEINSEEEFVSYVEDEIDKQDIPALSLLVFNNNQVKLERYWGKASLEKNIFLEENHLFLLASISKTITATALLQLYDRDSFELDDKINDYLPFSVNVPNHAKPITFRMLLTHTSGIADGDALDNQYYYGEDSPVQLRFFLQNYLEPNGQFYNAAQNYHNFQPGPTHE